MKFGFSLKKDITQKELMAMKARLYLNMGLIHDYKGNLTKCADLIKQAIHVNEMYDLKEDLNRCQYSLASIYYRSGNCSQALRTVDEAHACAIKLKDISLQSETLLLKSKILLRINDFEGAKYYLKKSYKLNIPNEIVRIEIKKLLKICMIMLFKILKMYTNSFFIALDLCRLEKEISILTNDDFNGKMIIYEKLGDLCAKIECFDRSLNFYNKMLECAEVLNISESEKATIYYSLAETYFDLKKFNFAMDFYHKELNSRTGNLKEECKTWLNIAECQFRLKKEFHDLQRSYSHALDCAKEANDIRLQVNCSKNLIRVQEVFNIIDEKIATEKSLEELIKNNNELSEDEDTQNLSQTSSTSELTDLSASSSNSEAENEEFDRPQRKGRKASAKKNEKGETQLHRACITGNINMVRRLIEKGHPVNPRDNCGWIPLHEAANHDHYDIVEYLLGKGAWVNDRGGIHCDGITPLHDAASCANFSIMQLLIEHGASVIAKMNDGQTPLDCLKKWRTRVGEDLEQHLIKEYNEMRDKLQQMTCGVDVESGGLNENQPISSGAFQHMEELVAVQSDEEDEPMERVTRNQLKKRSVTESFSDDDEFAVFNDRKKSRIQDDDGSRSGADSPVDNSEVARHEYRSAIDCVRSATSRINQGEIEPVQRKSEKKLALINEDDVIVDDWLEDDIGPATKSNTVTAWPMFRSGPSGNSGLKSNTSRKTKWKRPKLKQLKFDSLLKSRNEPRRAVDNSEVLEDVECVETVNGDNYQQFAPNQPAQLQTSEYNNFSTGMRVRVRIEGKLLLIPIIQRDSDQSVSWLAEEAANRYHQMFGLRPVLRLCAADGAVLGSNDKITEVIAGGEELLGNTEHWDLPPLNNRYLEACNALKTEPFLNLKHHMEMASISNDLSVLNLCLGPKHLQITFRALQCEYALRHLSLAGNYMGNKGLQMLANILSTLPNLVHLDLSCNNITNLQCLSDIVNKKINAQDIKPLQVLADLNLSYNCLEATVPALSTLLVSLPLLSHLEIACCSLDINIMKKQSSLVKAFAGKDLIF
uniref:Tonsoku-like protein n=1 Tax=Strigamia maritima TaxID=126957 RepID=T1J276_STRMM